MFFSVLQDCIRFFSDLLRGVHLRNADDFKPAVDAALQIVAGKPDMEFHIEPSQRLSVLLVP